MGNGWIVAGVFVATLSIAFKVYFGKKQEKNRKIIWYLLILLKKGDSLSAFSFVQLLGMIWIVQGIFINLNEKLLINIPGTLVFASECFIPILIVYLISKLLVR